MCQSDTGGHQITFQEMLTWTSLPLTVRIPSISVSCWSLVTQLLLVISYSYVMALAFPALHFVALTF